MEKKLPAGMPKVKKPELQDERREAFLNWAIDATVKVAPIRLFSMAVLQNAGFRFGDYVSFGHNRWFQLMLVVCAMRREDAVSFALGGFRLIESGKFTDDEVCEFLGDYICTHRKSIVDLDDRTYADWTTV